MAGDQHVTTFNTPEFTLGNAQQHAQYLIHAACVWEVVLPHFCNTVTTFLTSTQTRHRTFH
jgi:hypothetical protein